MLWVFMDLTPSVYRRDRTRSEIHAEQGKPVTLPETAGEPQGTLLTLRVKEYGKSERLSVMDGIRTETRPTRKWADFRLVSPHKRVRRTS